MKRLKILNDNSGGGGGGDGGDGGGREDFGGDFNGVSRGDERFGDSTRGEGASSAIEIPTIEVTGGADSAPSTGIIPSGIDPRLLALNEEKGLSWGCALQSAVGGWEAGLACSLLEDKYEKGDGPPPKKAYPLKRPTPAPPLLPTAPKPVPAPPKTPTSAPVPKKNDGPGWRGVGPPRAIPR